MFGSGELRLVLLHLLGETPRHGYELIKAIEELTGGQYAPSPGVVYPTLQMLADEGAIVETPGETARKAFEPTEAGRRELAERGEEADAIISRLSSLGARSQSGRSPQLWRALANLANVLRHKARAGGLTPEQMDAIVDLVDDAARRIERL